MRCGFSRAMAVLALFWLMPVSGCAAPVNKSSLPGAGYREGELLVKFKPEVTGKWALELIADRGGAVLLLQPGIDVYKIRLRPGQSVAEGIKEYGALPEVLYAEPNYIVRKTPVKPDTELQSK